MKNLLVILSLLFISTCQVFCQNTMSSPRDSARGTVDGAVVSVNYGSPSVKDRKIWGKLVPYGKVWRTGANEATRFSTSKDLMVEGKPLAAGTYALFTIPAENEWTVIFNKTSRQWGAFEYSDKEDALRVQVAPSRSDSLKERLTFSVVDNKLLMHWENLELPIRLSAAEKSK